MFHLQTLAVDLDYRVPLKLCISYTHIWPLPTKSNGHKPDGSRLNDNCNVNISRSCNFYLGHVSCRIILNVHRVSQNLCHKLFLGIFHPQLSKKSSYQHGSKSEQVLRYSLLCRNLRNAVINTKHVTMSNA